MQSVTGKPSGICWALRFIFGAPVQMALPRAGAHGSEDSAALHPPDSVTDLTVLAPPAQH